MGSNDNVPKALVYISTRELKKIENKMLSIKLFG